MTEQEALYLLKESGVSIGHLMELFCPTCQEWKTWRVRYIGSINVVIEDVNSYGNRLYLSPQEFLQLYLDEGDDDGSDL